MSNAAPCDPAVAWKTPLLYNDNPTNYGFGTVAAQAGQIDTPGAIRQDIDPAGGGRRTFRFALLANSPNVTTGQVVLFDKPANVANIAANLVPPGTVLGNTCVVTANLAQSVGANTTGTQQDMVAGVALQNVTVNNYSWFQLTGPHPNVVSTGTIAAGDQVIYSTTNGTVAALTANVTAGSGAAVQSVGRAIGANAANTTTPIFLNLPEF